MTGVVVVGGGIAGVSTIAALRAGGFDGDITLVDSGEFPYDRPPLSKDYLTGTTDFKDIALQAQEWYDEHRVRLINGTWVAALRPGAGAVELVGGASIPADWVVLGTGGRAARPPIPGSDSSRVHVLRTAEDADRLRDALVLGAEILIVGAGLIGAEVASTARALGCEVVLADPVFPPVAGAFGTDVAAWLHDLHIHNGITTVRAGAESFRDTSGGIAATLSGEHGSRGFDAVVLAVGMAPETTLAETAGLRTDRGVIVDRGQVTSNPAVLAVGDAARVCVDGTLLGRSEHWEAAQHDGRRAAAAILGVDAPVETAPWFWTDRHHLHVEAVGAMASAERVVMRGTLGTMPFSAFGLCGSRVVGAVSVGDPTATRAARRMIDRAVEVDPVRLAEPTTDLRKLLRAGRAGVRNGCLVTFAE